MTKTYVNQTNGKAHVPSALNPHMSVTTACCDCGGCGCELCFPQGDKLIAYSTSPCEELDGMVKYFTLEGGCWVADVDSSSNFPGFYPCFFLNPGGGQPPTRICCDLTSTKCSTGGCYDYYMDHHAYECSDEVDHCVDDCKCSPTSDFYLTFTNIFVDPEPQHPGGGSTWYYCTCACDWNSSAITVGWHLTRLIHCCCPGLDSTGILKLSATIKSTSTELCTGTMEDAFDYLYPSGVECRTWGTSSNLKFTCGDDTTIRGISLSMACNFGGVTGGECCDDYQLTLNWQNVSTCCQTSDANQTKGIVGDCTCAPLNLVFGPFRMWWNTSTDYPGCCNCCEEFYIVVAE